MPRCPVAATKPGLLELRLLDEDGDLHPVGAVELVEDAEHVRLHGPHTHVEISRYVHVGLARRDRHGNIPFTFREPGQRRPRPAAAPRLGSLVTTAPGATAPG